jgi:hypothetical protein
MQRFLNRSKAGPVVDGNPGTKCVGQEPTRLPDRDKTVKVLSLMPPRAILATMEIRDRQKSGLLRIRNPFILTSRID